MAGRTDDAATHDLRADRLALGNSPAAIRIANAYAFGGDYQRAADWWKRAAMWVDPDSSDCALALKAHADELLSTDEWQTCAAVSEVLAAIHAGSEYDWVNPLPAARLRMHADMARAFVLLPRDGPRALAMLARCHRDFASDGALADYFFPALRRNGLLREHDQWFQQTWQLMQQSLRLYPDADNTLNTAAWFAARSMRRLDDAARLIRKAISHQPEQAAYLDTMAEIQFARGDRVAALEWSAKALMQAPDDPLLRRQHARFRHGPPPE
jgi:tetratricopeptide (TPR) repeat protein